MVVMVVRQQHLQQLQAPQRQQWQLLGHSEKKGKEKVRQSRREEVTDWKCKLELMMKSDGDDQRSRGKKRRGNRTSMENENKSESGEEVTVIWGRDCNLRVG